MDENQKNCVHRVINDPSLDFLRWARLDNDWKTAKNKMIKKDEKWGKV